MAQFILKNPRTGEEIIIGLDLARAEHIGFKEKEKETGWEREENKTYWHIGGDGILYCYLDESDVEDYGFYNIANYFKSKEKAEEISAKQTLWRLLQRYADEHNPVPVQGAGTLYSIRWNRVCARLDIIEVLPETDCRCLADVLFTNYTVADDALEKFKPLWHQIYINKNYDLTDLINEGDSSYEK